MPGDQYRTVTVSYELQVDPEEMRRRGALGGRATHARHDSRALTEPGRRAFLARFATDAERREYFAELGRKSAAARRERALAAAGGAA